MKNKHSKMIALLSACCFVAAAIMIPRSETKTCEAATSAERIFFDNFDAQTLDSRRWNADESSVSLQKQYNVLRLNLADEWGPAVTLRQYKIEGDCNITFTFTQTSGNGWLGLAFGNKNAGDFTKGAKHVLRLEEKSVSLHSADISGVLNDASVEQNRVQNEKTEAIRANSANDHRCTVQINLKKRENGNYEMRVLVGAEGKIAEEIVTYGAESGKEPDGVSADGYLAFCGQNVKADVTSFTIESNGKTTFESAFTHDELAYPDESQNGKIWTISGRYGEKAVYCGAANRVGLSAGRGLRSNTAVEANTETEKTFELSFKWYYSAAETPQNSYVGVRFGCDKSENFAGIGKKDGNTVLVWYAKSEIRAFVPLSAEAVAEGENTLLFRGKFGEKLEIEANGVTHELDNFDTTGNFALSLYRTGETGNEAAGDTAKIEIDDALFVRYVSRNSKAESVSNDFSGVKISEIEASDGILSVKEYYINRSAYYVGAEVNLPLVYAEGKKGSLLFGECKNYGYFAPKKEYSEWIMRFDLRVTDERNVKQNPDGSFDLPKLKSGAMLGVSFGKEYAAQSATETDGIFFYNWYNPDFTEGKQTYTGADGQVYCGTYLAASDTEKSSWKFGNAPISYDLWGDKSAVYNIMVIAENSTAKLYMKRADESAEKMSSPIFTVTGVN
ncbi:MAG: hypothetical protein ACLTAN_05655, partial [Christensenellaceae bacterium]